LLADLACWCWPQRAVINVDESSVGRYPYARPSGRAPRGDPVHLWEYASADGVQRSIIAALTLRGNVEEATTILEGGVTADIWYEEYFQPLLLPILEPYDVRELEHRCGLLCTRRAVTAGADCMWAAASVLFMDGFSGHLDERVLGDLAERGTMFLRNAAGIVRAQMYSFRVCHVFVTDAR
jgi:hypothetical protein